MNILLISEETDKTSDIVCSYLFHWHVPYTRINSNTSYKSAVSINGTCNEIITIMKFGDNAINLMNVKKTWFRRGLLFLCDNDSFIMALPELDYFIENESTTLKGFLYESMSINQKINDPAIYNYNKLCALSCATKVGLKIPNTLISKNGTEIKKFIHANGRCITKSIQDFYEKQSSERYVIVGEVSRVKPEDITQNSYWYSMFQQEIPKKYELRVFYFCKKIYSMAIFSQMDQNSALDYRDVDPNGVHPNRMVPYLLPKEVKKKISKLMKLLNLESGSLDLIVTPTDEYYFLEVNPAGQFNFVSELCNYYIERDIAKYLSK